MIVLLNTNNNELFKNFLNGSTRKFTDLITGQDIYISSSKSSKFGIMASTYVNKNVLVRVERHAYMLRSYTNIGSVLIYNKATILTDKQQKIFKDENPEYFI